MRNDEVVIVRWGGSGGGSSSEWEAAIWNPLEPLVKRGANVVLNIDGLVQISSIEIVRLINLVRRLVPNGGELVLSAPTRPLRSTFDAIGLEELVPIFPTDEAALRHFGHDGDDGSDGIGSRLNPWQPSDSGVALPDEESPDLDERQ